MFYGQISLVVVSFATSPQSIPDKSVPYCSLTEEEEHTHYVLAARYILRGRADRTYQM